LVFPHLADSPLALGDLAAMGTKFTAHAGIL